MNGSNFWDPNLLGQRKDPVAELHSWQREGFRQTGKDVSVARPGAVPPRSREKLCDFFRIFPFEQWKKPWLFRIYIYIGDYTTHLYGDYNESIISNQHNGK